MSNLTKCQDCGAVMNPAWGKCLACHSPRKQIETPEAIERTLKGLSGKPEDPASKACRSFTFSEPEGLKKCGQGWTCPKCELLAGLRSSDPRVVYFWSQVLGKYLDLTIPEGDLYDFQKVMTARKEREKGLLPSIQGETRGIDKAL